MDRRQAELIAKLAAIAPKARLAKATTAKIPSTPMTRIAAMSGLGALGEDTRYTSTASYFNPLNWWGSATDAIADNVMTPILNATGYMAPTDQEIKNAERLVSDLKVSAVTKPSSDPVARQNVATAVGEGEKLVSDMKEAKAKVMSLDWVKEMFAKYKMYATIGGLGLVGAVGYGLYGRARGKK